jgi:hypothetical protein
MCVCASVFVCACEDSLIVIACVECALIATGQCSVLFVCLSQMCLLHCPLSDIVLSQFDDTYTHFCCFEVQYSLLLLKPVQ